MLQNEIHRHSEDGNIETDVIEDIFHQLQPSKVLSSMKSKHSMDKILIDQLNMIVPQKEELGVSHVWVKQVTAPFLRLKQVKDLAVTVPFLPSLKYLMLNEQVRFQVENPKVSNDGKLRSILDGSYYKNNEFFKSNPNSLGIMGYGDELGVANPLGASPRKQKLYMFYWNLANIYPEFRSSLDVQQLIGITKTTVVKKYGLKAVLSSFLNDLKVLETEGIKIEVDGIEKSYKGSLLFVAADNPAAAEFGGFKQSVSAHCPCRTCLTTLDDLKLHYHERYFTMRDLQTHEEHLSYIVEPNIPKHIFNHWSREFGVNSVGIFGEFKGFDVTKCLPHDSMHVFLEGVLEIEIRALLRFFIDEVQSFDIAALNERITNFDFDYFKKNKPATILKEHIEKDTILKQSASQILSLGHCLPFLLDEWIFDSRKEIADRVLLHADLLQILNLVLSYEISVDKIELLQRMIEIFDLKFERLYPDTSVPKFHFATHIPGNIESFGPGRQQWTMRFEAAHNYYKSLVPVIRSFKNLPFSLAYRHQAYLATKMTSVSGSPNPNFLYAGDDISPGEIVLLQNLPNCELLFKYMNVNRDESSLIMRTPKVVRHSMIYEPKNVILISCDEDARPVFARINEIFIINEQIVIVYKLLFVEHYCKPLNAYSIKEDPTQTQETIMIDNLVFPHAIPKLTSNGSKYVLLLNHEFTEFIG